VRSRKLRSSWRSADPRSRSRELVEIGVTNAVRSTDTEVAHSHFASGATTTPSRQRISAFWTPCGGKRRQLATIGAGRPSAAKPGPRATSVPNRRTSLPENASASPERKRWLPAMSFIMTAPIRWSSFERTTRGRPLGTRSP